MLSAKFFVLITIICSGFAFCSASRVFAGGIGFINGWWGGHRTDSIFRVGKCNDCDDREAVGPLGTVSIEKFVNRLVASKVSSFSVFPPLWSDGRRGSHCVACHSDDPHVMPPFFRMPWRRVEGVGVGKACDGLNKWDLSKFDPEYFDRLKQLAEALNAKGVKLIYSFYLHHNLVGKNASKQAHYVDFPWRPTNNINGVSMPLQIPAADDFFNISNNLTRALHEKYFDHVIQSIGSLNNVILMPAYEYTGDDRFLRFFVDQLRKRGVPPDRIGIGAPKNIIDTIFSDSKLMSDVGVVDLSYWWFKEDGSSFFPEGGKQISGRYIGSEYISPSSIYRQVSEIRRRFPAKLIFHQFPLDGDSIWAFLMAGGDIALSYSEYPNNQLVTSDVMPTTQSLTREIQLKIQQLTLSTETRFIPDAWNADFAHAHSDKTEAYFFFSANKSMMIKLPEGRGILYDPRQNIIEPINQLGLRVGPERKGWMLFVPKTRG